MRGFTWRDGVLHADDIPLPAIVEAVGTPTYVYSAPAIRDTYRSLEEAFAPLGAEIHYAVKASPNLHLCRLLRGLGAGMDVVSGGEMERAWLAGTPMADIVFAGVGKTDDEIRAALDGRFSPVRDVAARFGAPDAAARGPVGMFNVESESELAAIARLGEELGVPGRVCVRVNPNVDPHTHEYTTTGKEENKFGIDAPRVVELFDRWSVHPGLRMLGLHVHIGSPVSTVEPYVQAVEVLLTLIDDLAAHGHEVEVLDLGGGWPAAYRDGETLPLSAYAERLVPLLAPRVARGLRIVLEPGRSILANAGLLVTRVQHIKEGRSRRFVICDAGMQTLLRPSLYRAFHFIWPVLWSGPMPRRDEDPGLPDLARCDVVGPICESGDFLARDRPLPRVERDELLAVFSAGAYGISMASNYNDHGRPAEVLVDGSRVDVIHERQPLAHLLETERATRELELTPMARSVEA
ncbi:MAG: diaminopimelate decarboxylase [Thermoanaerobaculia bacterium]